jgi:diacylglycerol kinase
MTKFKCQGFNNTFKNARKGLRLALKAEDCIKIHFGAAAFVLIAALLLGFSAAEFCIIFLTIAMVIITEMINSAIEFAADAVFKNKYSKMVGMAKDIAAGAVMVATFTSVAIGVTLFLPALVRLFH